MKVSVLQESNTNDDGIDCSSSYQQDGVECLSDLSFVFREAARSLGYPYVTGVTIHTEAGNFSSPDFI
jgi:hypothetical protein